MFLIRGWCVIVQLPHLGFCRILPWWWSFRGWYYSCPFGGQRQYTLTFMSFRLNLGCQELSDCLGTTTNISKWTASLPIKKWKFRDLHAASGWCKESIRLLNIRPWTSDGNRPWWVRFLQSYLEEQGSFKALKSFTYHTFPQYSMILKFLRPLGSASCQAEMNFCQCFVHCLSNTSGSVLYLGPFSPQPVFPHSWITLHLPAVEWSCFSTV